MDTNMKPSFEQLNEMWRLLWGKQGCPNCGRNEGIDIGVAKWLVMCLLFWLSGIDVVELKQELEGRCAMPVNISELIEMVKKCLGT